MENLLEIIRQGQTFALPELAKRLQITEELLSAMLERYENRGGFGILGERERL